MRASVIPFSRNNLPIKEINPKGGIKPDPLFLNDIPLFPPSHICSIKYID